MDNRSFVEPDDIAPTLALLTALHAAGGASDLPTVSRLRTLLLARLWQPERDARLWLDEQGRPCGFAGIFRPAESGTYLPLTIFARADRSAKVASAALAWAETRAAAHAAMLGREVSLCVTLAHDDQLRAAWLGAEGYDRAMAGDVVTLARSLHDLTRGPELPAGFRLAAMPQPEELARHSTVYAPILMRRGPEQRRRLMAHPDYEPDLEFIALTADGAVAAYCEGSLSRAAWAATGGRIGEIDWIATHPDLRQRGLGRALLTVALHRLRAAGADTARLFTEVGNDGARRLYRELGFAQVGAGRCYARAIGPGD